MGGSVLGPAGSAGQDKNQPCREANCPDRHAHYTPDGKNALLAADCAWHAICCCRREFKRLGGRMLWTSFVMLLLLWCIGLATSFTLSGFIHLLPLMAGVVALVGT